MRIATPQFAVTGDIAHNFYEIKRAINEAKAEGAQLVIFPECCLTGYMPRDLPNSSVVDFGMVNNICSKLQTLSDEQDISFIVGTIYKENGQIFNRAILFQPENNNAYMIRGLCGDGIKTISPRATVKAYLISGTLQ